ncbi:hypothetical protein PMAYCL1PPCAC_02486, partial [Pristionchus mayeri]
ILSVQISESIMTDELMAAEPPKEKTPIDKPQSVPTALKMPADEGGEKKVKGKGKGKISKAIASTDKQSSSKSEGTNKDSKPSTAEKSDCSDVISKKKRAPRKKVAKTDSKKSEASEEKIAETREADESTKGDEDKKSHKASKRRERAKKKASQTTSSSTSKSLSAEGLALLQDISAKAEARRSKSGIRTGKISMTELMGDGCTPADNELSRLRLNNISPESLLKTAFDNMPQVPGFPSLTHRPDPGPFSNSFRPELFKTTMEAYATAATLNCSGNEGAFGKDISPRNGRYSPDQILPWVSFAPMYPIDPSRGRANSSSSSIFKGPPTNGPGGFRSPNVPGFPRPPFNPNNNYQRGSMSPHQTFGHQGQARPSYSTTSHSNSNQKT